MAYSASMAAFILDQLSEFDAISTKKMFGALAFYHHGVLFGAVMGDQFTLRALAEYESKYLAAGMQRHVISGRKQRMPYFEVPLGIIEDREALAEWVIAAYADAKHKA